MKRLAAVLMLCLLLPACALAFDLSPYLLPPETAYESTFDLYPLSQGVFYRRSSECVFRDAGNPEDTVFVARLQRYENGSCTWEVTFPEVDHSDYTPVFRDSALHSVVCGVSYTTPREAWKYTYALCRLEDTRLTHAQAFEGSPYTLRTLHEGFAGLCTADAGQSLLRVYDENTRPRFSYTVPFENAFIQSAVSSGDLLYLLIRQKGSPRNPSSLMLCLDASASLSWSSPCIDEDNRYNSLLPDGQRGVLLTGPLAEDYKQYRVTRLDAAGNRCWSKVLSAPNAIIHPCCAEAQPDGTVALYGSCVAKSRGLFTVFCLTLDASGSTLSLDVRDYAARADIEPNILQAADGTKLVYSFEVSLPDQPGVLVPFSELPAADNPGITLK